tara:strand:- start:856 stop:1077 length:222 start_codon:yes stop_codon:yes gene_type:complete
MVHFNGSRQGKKKAVKKMKQVDTNLKPIVQLQFNVPKTVADDKRIKPSEVFEGFKDNKSNNKSNKSNKSKSNK